MVLNYALHMLGGYLGGFLISYRALYLWSLIIQISSTIMLSANSPALLYLGLTLFAITSGVSTPCLHMMINQRYISDNNNREKYFLWNYACSNIGFFLGYSLAGYFHQDMNYKELFILCSISNILAVFVMILGWDSIKDIKTPLVSDILEKGIKIVNKRLSIIILLFFISIPVTYFMFELPKYSRNVIFIFSMAFICYFLWLSNKQKQIKYKKSIKLYVILSLFSMLFWSLYDLAPMALTLYEQYNVNTKLFHINISPQWLANINVLIISIGGFVLPPIFSRIRKLTPLTIPMQFILGIVFLGIGLSFLLIGALSANKLGITSVVWVCLFFVFQSLGELFITPIGYTMIAQLAPLRSQGLMMGAWMLMTSGTASVISSHLSSIVRVTNTHHNPINTNPEYINLFMTLSVLAFAGAILLFLIMRVKDYAAFFHGIDK
jgi:POT family proton-dependent oligopeptide transporter